jgi:phosphoribosylformylglycinamidine cyclo-ligase
MLDSDDVAALINLDAWQRPDVFNWLQQAGNIDESEMLRTFNCGIGYVICLPQGAAAAAIDKLTELGETATLIGEIVASGTEPEAGQIVLKR